MRMFPVELTHWLFQLIVKSWIIMVCFHINLSASCPKICHCSDNTGVMVVYCNSQNLDEIPKDLPADTVFLKLNENKIYHIPNNAFKHLNYLQELDLSKNAIEKIENAAFKGVAEGLKLLDLSNNHIHSIPKEALAKLTAKIRLSNNPWHCECELQEVLRELNLDPDSVNEITCYTSVQEEYTGKPLVKVLDDGINFCNIRHKTTDVAMFITMFGWFTMVITYIVYYVRHNEEDTNRHLDYLKSLPRTQIDKDYDTVSTVL